MSAADYLPRQDDAIRLPVRTNGISELAFTLDDVPFQIIHAGGQTNTKRRNGHRRRRMLGRSAHSIQAACAGSDALWVP